MNDFFIFSIDGQLFHVEIPEVSAHRNINKVFLDQLDFHCFYSEHNLQCNSRDVKIVDSIIKFKRGQTTKIWYRDFDRITSHMTIDASSYIKNTYGV